MVWDGISLIGRTDVVFLDRYLITIDYRNIILDNAMLPYASRINKNFQLMYDNARTHTASVVRAFLQNHKINVLQWI